MRNDIQSLDEDFAPVPVEGDSVGANKEPKKKSSITNKMFPPQSPVTSRLFSSSGTSVPPMSVPAFSPSAPFQPGWKSSEFEDELFKSDTEGDEIGGDSHSDGKKPKKRKKEVGSRVADSRRCSRKYDEEDGEDILMMVRKKNRGCKAKLRNCCGKLGKRFLSWVTNFLPLHVTFILSCAIIGATAIFILEKTMGHDDLSVIDAIYQTMSAVTCTGLTSVDISAWTIPSLAILVCLTQICGVCTCTCLTVTVLRYFRVRSIWQKHTQRASEIAVTACDDESDESETLINVPRSRKSETNLFLHDYNMERQALKRLIFVIIGYQWGLQTICFLIMGFYLRFSSKYELMQQRNVNCWWWSAFHCFSAFNNAGFAIFQDGMAPFQTDYTILLTLSFLICAGNTMLPLGIRFAVWLTRNFTYERKLPKYEQPLRYVLTEPTRCSLHIFPGIHTKILMIVFGVLNVTDTVAFIGFQWNSQYSCRWLDGFFLSVCSRTAGFSLLNMDALQDPLLWIYIKSMFISAYPIAYVRKYREEEIKNEARQSTAPYSKLKTLCRYLTDVAFHPFLWLYLAIFIIAAFECSSTDPEIASIFKIIFEVTSAYGTVGLSVGYPGVPYSYSGVLGICSKFILMTVMMMGRHRGLPKHVYHRDTREGKEQLVPLADLTQETRTL
ncbi:potassium transporter [Pelomyxa schiedti]|nr:potassium transporter [Pelomyxa schiedti]